MHRLQWMHSSYGAPAATRLGKYPYEEAFFAGKAREFRARLAMPLVLLGGISRLP